MRRTEAGPATSASYPLPLALAPVRFPPTLTSGRFRRRVNRFLAEVEVNGRPALAHVANSGRNRELFTPGREVRLWPRGEAHRKTAFDLSLVRYASRWVSVGARLPNRLVREAWGERRLPGFRQYSSLKAEVPVGDSRIDFVFQRAGTRCYVEVKSVTLVRDGVALFPDAPTTRGAKHLRALARLVQDGHRGAVVFVVQRPDARELCPHSSADPVFAEACAAARSAGVRLLAFTCRVTTREALLSQAIPVRLPR